MSDPARVRALVVIVTLIVAGALAVGLSTVPAGPHGPCSTPFAEGLYCTATVTVGYWCPWGAPCPADGEQATVQGYVFHFFGVVDMNHTLSLSVDIALTNATSPLYSFNLWSNPYGTSTSWLSPDRSMFVWWPDMPIGTPKSPLSVYVICGVAAP